MFSLVWIESLFMLIDICLILISVYQGGFRKSFSTILIIVTYFGFALGTFFLSHTELMQNIAFVGMIFCVAIPMIAIRNMRLRDILFVSLFVIGVASGIVVSCLRIAELYHINEIGLYLVDIVANTFVLLMCIFFTRSSISKRISADISFIPGKIKALLISSIWIGVTFAYTLSVFFVNYQSLPAIIFLTFLSVAMIAIMSIACPLLVMYNISKLNYQLALAAAQKQMNDQVKHYEALVANDYEFKKFKHDFKNYRIAIQELLLSGDTKGVIQCLDRLEKPLELDSAAFDSGDRLLNVLLGDKQVYASKINTEIMFDGMLPNRLLLPEDVCLIFGNTIDNALEACEKLPGHEEKIIQVSCVYSSGFLFIKITNLVETDVQIVRNSIKSTKIDGTSTALACFRYEMQSNGIRA